MAATSRSMTYTTPQLESPRWAGRSIAPCHLMPGGGKLDNTAFGAVDSAGRLTIPSGTVVGRTISERNANSPFGPAADTDVDIYIVAYDVRDAMVNDDCELVAPYSGLLIKENYLPTPLASLTTAVQALVRGKWPTTLGVN